MIPSPDCSGTLEEEEEGEEEEEEEEDPEIRRLEKIETSEVWVLLVLSSIGSAYPLAHALRGDLLSPPMLA